MQIVIPYDKYNPNNILFSNRTDNTVIVGGGFYRAMYCNKHLTILGINILFDVDINKETNGVNQDTREIINTTCEKIKYIEQKIIQDIYNKWKNTCGVNKTFNFQNTNINIEQIVIKALDSLKKSPNNGNSNKLFFTLKCSGVYDTCFDAGVSFRINHLTNIQNY